MSDPDDPLNPEAWFAEPGVCGSCVAWKPGETGPEETVAIGLCRLRPEMRRVPASLKKCPKYNPRGGFTYRGATVPEPSRRKKSGKAVIKRRNEAGELVDVTPPSKPRAPRAPRPSRADVASARASDGVLVNYVAPPEPSYREFPSPIDPVPVSVDLEGMTAPLVEAALVDLIREEVPGRRRDIHSKFRQGGKVKVTDAEGHERSFSAAQVFAYFEGLAKSLDALEEAIDTHPSFDAEALELSDLVRKMRGSFTTFNVMFADRSDYFSGKG